MSSTRTHHHHRWITKKNPFYVLFVFVFFLSLSSLTNLIVVLVEAGSSPITIHPSIPLTELLSITSSSSNTAVAADQQPLRLCRVHEDRYGDWYNTSDILALPKEKQDLLLSKRFILPSPVTIGGPEGVAIADSNTKVSNLGGALDWTEVYLTKDCSVHRFTNHSVHHFVRHLLDEKANKEKAKEELAKAADPNTVVLPHTAGEPIEIPTDYTQKKPTVTYPNEIHIYILGDSGTRAVFCGLTRILSGSELYGPCWNTVCGTPGTIPITYKHTNQYYDVHFGPHLRFTYIYIKSLLHAKTHTDWILEGAVKTKPYAVIINTGAWDYDHIARSHMGQSITTEFCDTNETDHVSRERSSERIKNIFVEVGAMAKKFGVRAIYRNSHHNARFGTNCADDRLQMLLRHQETSSTEASSTDTGSSSPSSAPSSSLGEDTAALKRKGQKDENSFRTSLNTSTGWEIWDNRYMSYAVWKEQNYDGFHFDRHRVHTYQHHQAHMQYFKVRNWILPGELEIQLAQSLLFTLFHDCIEFYIKNKKEITPIWATWPLMEK